MAERLGATPLQVALAWLLHRSPDILLIPGTSLFYQLPQHVLEPIFVGVTAQIARGGFELLGLSAGVCLAFRCDLAMTVSSKSCLLWSSEAGFLTEGS